MKTIAKRTAGTLILPVAMYLVMMALCYSNGKMYFGTWTMWRSLIADIALSATCAMGIGLQFKSGRFDFSGGAIMLLAAIVAGNVARDAGDSLVVLLGVSLAVCVACSLLVAVIYVYGRMPIVIVTIGMALLFEAVTCLIYNGGGINLVGNSTLKTFSSFPGVLIPFLCCIAVYVFYSYFTTTGKRAALLANNQQASVNIGVHEGRNVLISYLYSGILFGFATTIYCTTARLNAAFSSLQTVSSLFSNILPVFIALALSAFCGDFVGILMGSVALCLMSFGLEAVYTAEFGAALSLILTGVFVLLFNFVAGQGQVFRRIGASLTARFGQGTSKGEERS